MGTMDRRTYAFSIPRRPTPLEALGWFALGSSAAAMNFNTRISISTAPRLNQNDPDAVGLDGVILLLRQGGVIAGEERVSLAFDRANQVRDARYQGRWAMVA